MVRLKNIVELNGDNTGLYFIIILELSSAIVAICTGANLHDSITSSCKGFRSLGITLIFIGVILLILFFVTILLARTPKLAIGKSLCCSVPLVFTLFVLGVLALAVSSKGGGESIPGKSYEEYDVESYSKWMQNKVNGDNWEKYYKKVVVMNKELLCNKNVVLFRANPALKHGCCQPPEECNFNYTKSQVWRKPENESNSNNDDCNKWDNDPNTLCFNCQSCKAGFLEDVTSHWFVTGIGLIVVSNVPLLIAIIGFVVFMFNSRGDLSQLHRPLI
ncbi:Tetraspanin-9 [Bienertia sinuspersici]